jgi:hypothetical protein
LLGFRPAGPTPVVALFPSPPSLLIPGPAQIGAWQLPAQTSSFLHLADEPGPLVGFIPSSASHVAETETAVPRPHSPRGGASRATDPICGSARPSSPSLLPLQFLHSHAFTSTRRTTTDLRRSRHRGKTVPAASPPRFGYRWSSPSRKEALYEFNSLILTPVPHKPPSASLSNLPSSLRFHPPYCHGELPRTPLYLPMLLFSRILASRALPEHADELLLAVVHGEPVRALPRPRNALYRTRLHLYFSPLSFNLKMEPPNSRFAYPSELLAVNNGGGAAIPSPSGGPHLSPPI